MRERARSSSKNRPLQAAFTGRFTALTGALVHARPSSSMDICAGLSWIVPLRTGGQQKRPSSSRFVAKISPVPSQPGFQPVASLRTEDEHIAAKGIGFQRLRHQRGDGVHALSEIDRLRSQENAPAAGNPDHAVSRSAASTVLSAALPTAPSTRTRAPASSISITPQDAAMAASSSPSPLSSASVIGMNGAVAAVACRA